MLEANLFFLTPLTKPLVLSGYLMSDVRSGSVRITRSFVTFYGLSEKIKCDINVNNLLDMRYVLNIASQCQSYPRKH